MRPSAHIRQSLLAIRILDMIEEFKLMVQAEGIEPSILLRPWILSPVCIPVPACLHITMETPVGFEPTLVELQSTALPIWLRCHKLNIIFLRPLLKED